MKVINKNGAAIDFDFAVSMIDVRGKLIELLDNNFGYVDEVKAEVLADILIRNGVTIIEEQGKTEKIIEDMRREGGLE